MSTTPTPLDRATQAVRDTYDDPAGVSGLPPMPLDRAAATAAVTAALDVEEMARAMDPDAFEDHPFEARSKVAALQWAARRKIALDHAVALRASILGGAR